MGITASAHRYGRTDCQTVEASEPFDHLVQEQGLGHIVQMMQANPHYLCAHGINPDYLDFMQQQYEIQC
jgi:hypothetical protein